jgi:hypothetical protein
MALQQQMLHGSGVTLSSGQTQGRRPNHPPGRALLASNFPSGPGRVRTHTSPPPRSGVPVNGAQRVNHPPPPPSQGVC